MIFSALTRAALMAKGVCSSGFTSLVLAWSPLRQETLHTPVAETHMTPGTMLWYRDDLGLPMVFDGSCPSLIWTMICCALTRAALKAKGVFSCGVTSLVLFWPPLRQQTLHSPFADTHLTPGTPLWYRVDLRVPRMPLGISCPSLIWTMIFSALTRAALMAKGVCSSGFTSLVLAWSPLRQETLHTVAPRCTVDLNLTSPTLDLAWPWILSTPACTVSEVSESARPWRKLISCPGVPAFFRMVSLDFCGGVLIASFAVTATPNMVTPSIARRKHPMAQLSGRGGLCSDSDGALP